MTKTQLVDTEQDLSAVEEYAQELAVELAQERELMTAAERHCDNVERQLAIAECKVRLHGSYCALPCRVATSRTASC